SKVGHYQPGYDEYGELFKRIGNSSHQSCLILTSREKPKEVALLEGQTPKVCSWALRGLEEREGQKILQDKGCSGSQTQEEQLLTYYAGHPLALKLVATNIRDFYGGQIGELLTQIQQGAAQFADISDLLEQQLSRLSGAEQEVMYWLAINREPTSLATLQEDIVTTEAKRQLQNSLISLTRRSLVEKERQTNDFTQQPAVREYILERFMQQITAEIETEKICLFMSHALIKAQAKDYIRESQQRIILQPVAESLVEKYKQPQEIAAKLQQILGIIKSKYHNLPGYGGGNIINLCQELKLNLAAYDFSQLTIWQAYLQDAHLQNVNFAGADLAKSVFAKTLGSSLVVALGKRGILATGDAAGQILLWQVANGQQLLSCQGQTGRVKTLAFNPPGDLLASGGEDCRLRLWQVATGQCLQIWSGHENPINCLSFSEDNSFLASGSDDQTIKIWDIKTGECLQTLCGHNKRIHSLCFSPNNQILASSSDDQTVRIWDIKTGECLQPFFGDSSWLGAVTLAVQPYPLGEYHPGDRPEACFVAATSDDQIIQLWDINQGRCFRTLQGHEDNLSAFAFNPDSQILASSSDDGKVKLWDIPSRTCRRTLNIGENVYSLTFSPDQPILAIGSEDQTVQLWDLNLGKCLRTLRGQRNKIISFALNPDQQILATGSEDKTVQLWDLNTGSCAKILAGHLDWVCSLAFSPNQQVLATGSYDHTIKLWPITPAEGNENTTLRGHTDKIKVVVFSHDGKILATGSDDCTIKLWDTTTGQCLHTFSGHNRWISSIAFNHNGSILASSSYDRTIKLWDVTTGQCLHTLCGHSDRIHTLSFNPTQLTLASGSHDQSIKLWDLNNGECWQTWPSRSQIIQAVTFNPQGQLFVAGSCDHQIQWWQPDHEEVTTFSKCNNPIWLVNFSPFGKMIISASQDRTIELWNRETSQCLKTLRTDKPYDGTNIQGVTGITPAQQATLKALGAHSF
ncbi:MAG: WD40 repeat domain-containing protein, partial [Spirulinaceae cyanobacterium]